MADASAVEGDAVEFAVTVSQARPVATVLSYRTSHGTAGAGDYSGALAGSVTIGAGKASAVISVDTAEDSLVEPDETFTVTISGAPADSEIADATATGTIENDDAEPVRQQQADSEISIAGGSAAEGAAVVFTVSISPARSVATVLSYKTAHGTAGAGDYTGTQAGTVTIPAGAASAAITVNTAQDSTVEADETFTVTISGAPAGTAITAASATGTIENDDKYRISLSDASADEGDAVEFAVTVSQARSTDTVLSYKTAHGTAGAADYTGAQAGTVTVPAGDTTAAITVATAADDDAEDDETFTVTISGAPADSEIADATATGTIRDDDPQPQDQQPQTPSITVADAAAAEGSPITFTVAISPTRSTATTLAYTIADGLATAADYAGASTGTLTIPADAASTTLAVATKDDKSFEASETITLTLSGAPDGTTIADGFAIGTIDDNDNTITEVTVANGIYNGDGEERFVVSFDPPPQRDAVLSYYTTAGTAADGQYYPSADGKLFVAAGATSANIDVPIIVGTTASPAPVGTFTVTVGDLPDGFRFASASGSNTGTGSNHNTATGWYPSGFSYSRHYRIFPASAVEGEPLRLVVAKRHKNAKPLRLYLFRGHSPNERAWWDGPAGPHDASFASGEIEFPPNSHWTTVTIPTYDDHHTEKRERLLLRLLDYSSGIVDPKTQLLHDAFGHIIDDDGADFGPVSTPAGPLAMTTSSPGNTGTYNVSLTAPPPPGDTYQLRVQASRNHYIEAYPNVLEFTAENYNTPQEITVRAFPNWRAPENSLLKPTILHELIDPNTNLVTGRQVLTANLTSDTAQLPNHGLKRLAVEEIYLARQIVYLSEEAGDRTTEYFVRLTHPPVGNDPVVVNVVNPDTAKITVSPSSLTFTKSNYLSVQRVTVTVTPDADKSPESIVLEHKAAGYETAKAQVYVYDGEPELGLKTFIVWRHVWQNPLVFEHVHPWVETDAVYAQAGTRHALWRTDGNIYIGWESVDAPGKDAEITVTSGSARLKVASGGRVKLEGSSPNQRGYAHLVAPGGSNVAVEDVVVTITLTNGQGSTTSKEVTVTLLSENHPTITVAPSDVEISKGASQTFTVTLSHDPGRDVNVQVRPIPGQGSGLSITPTSFRVTRSGATKWDVPRQFTVTASNDTVMVGKKQAFRIGFDGSFSNGVWFGPRRETFHVTKTAPLQSLEFDKTSIQLDETDDTAAKGESFTVKMKADPGIGKSVLVNLAKAEGLYFDVDGTAKEEVALTFNGGSTGTKDWNVAQTIKVFAYADVDADDDTMTLEWTLEDATSRELLELGHAVSVTVADEVTPQIQVSESGPIALSEKGDKVEYCFAPNFRDTDLGNTSFRVDRTPIVISITNSDPGAVSLSRTRITFAPYDFTKDSPWSDGFKECVDVVAVPDADSNNPASVTLSHTVSGYYGVTSTPDITVNVTDNHVLAINVTSTALVVPEKGAAVEYCFEPSITDQDAALRSFNERRQPIRIAVGASPPGKVAVSPSTVTFRPYDRSKPSPYAKGFKECVMVRGIADDDTNDETVTLTHTVSGYFALTSAPGVSVTVAEASLVVFEKQLRVEEGLDKAKDYISVKLPQAPTSDVTVTPSASPSSSDLRFDKQSLTFTSSNWNQYQVIAVSAADDADADDERWGVVLSATGGGYAIGTAVVPVVVIDDEVSTISISDGATQREWDLVTLTITLSGRRSEPISLIVTLEDGTATHPQDYSNFFRVYSPYRSKKSGSRVAIPAFAQEIVIVVATIYDANNAPVEGTEEFKVVLSDAPERTRFTKAEATVTINE